METACRRISREVDCHHDRNSKRYREHCKRRPHRLGSQRPQNQAHEQKPPSPHQRTTASSIRPSRSRKIRSTREVLSALWVASITATSNSAAVRARMLRTISPVAVSRFPVGSSASTSGDCGPALAQSQRVVVLRRRVDAANARRIAPFLPSAGFRAPSRAPFFFEPATAGVLHSRPQSMCAAVEMTGK